VQTNKLAQLVLQVLHMSEQTSVAFVRHVLVSYTRKTQRVDVTFAVEETLHSTRQLKSAKIAPFRDLLP